MGAPSTTAQSSNADDLQKPVSNVVDNTSLSTFLSLIQQYLAVFMVDNATFLAERCVAEYPNNSEALYLLALCYYRAGSPKRGRLVLAQPTVSLTGPMRYLFAQCSYELKEYSRAEDVLLVDCRAEIMRMSHRYGGETSAFSMDEWIVQTTPCPVPNGAAGLALLGKICRKSNRTERAKKYFKMSLQLDPFLWTSFEALAELGEVDYNAATVFGVSLPVSTEIGTAAGATPTPLQPMSTPAPIGAGHHAPQPQSASFGAPSVLRNRSVHFLETPGLTPIPMNQSLMPAESTPPPGGGKASAAPQNPQVIRRARDVASRQYYAPSPETPVTHVTRSMRYLKGLGGAADNSEHGGRSLFLSSSSENQVSNQSVAAAARDEASENNGKPDKEPADKVNSVLELLSVMGAAYQRVCSYRCREALQLLLSLPVRQQSTGWVLHQQGRAYLELNDFRNAERCLELMQTKDPGRIRGLELLSTVYWQLKKEVELAYLSQRVVEMDRLAPEAWCVVGNCFSLQKDHESALVFFKRSLQLDNDFTYTHTLSGYEYMANEDFDKAMQCFREALRIDERHYNAVYGIGAIYYRQEKFELAEKEFLRAVTINPSSSVLRCNLGIAQHANGKSYQALDTLAGAFRLDPRNPQARFQRATIYSALQRNEEAFSELQKVRDAAPREATVHFAMGKVLKRLGRQDEAMKCFLTAMDLDPKDNQMIKSAMDKLDEPDVDEEAMAAF